MSFSAGIKGGCWTVSLEAYFDIGGGFVREVDKLVRTSLHGAESKRVRLPEGEPGRRVRAEAKAASSAEQPPMAKQGRVLVGE